MRTGDPVGVREMEEEDNKSERDRNRGREYDACKLGCRMALVLHSTNLVSVQYCELLHTNECNKVFIIHLPQQHRVSSHTKYQVTWHLNAPVLIKAHCVC